MALTDEINDLSERVATEINAVRSETTSGLAGKANSTHTHTISNVTGLETALDGKAASSHEHDASDITEGTLSSLLFPPTLRNTISLSNSQNNEYAFDVDEYFTMVSLEITMNFNSGLAVPGGTPVNHHQLFIAARAQGGARTFAFASGVRLSTGLTTRSFDVPQNQVLLAAIEYVNLIDAWVLVAATVSES